MADNLQFKIDSKPAQADLVALAKALDTATAASVRMDKAFNTLAINTNANLTKAAQAMEKYARVAALLSKLNVAGNPMGQVRELASALDAIGRARAITTDKINNVRALGAALNTLKVPERLFGVATLLNALGRVRVPTQTQVKNLEELFIVLSGYKGSPEIGNLGRFFATVSTLKAPSKATLDNLQRLFFTLSEAKEIPGATRIVLQLDAIAAAAVRATKALTELPKAGGVASLMRAPNPATAAARGGAQNFGKTLDEGEKRATKARASFSLLGGSLGDLSSRFKLTYQAGTLMNAMFASLTIGGFLKSLYEANIQFLKLQKAVLFATGSFDGADHATDAFIGISQKLGLSIKDNIETYGRFVIAATASNLPLKQINDIYESIGTAMTVVGASAQQQQLAFYGLTEMMQKGVVYSKEFNRQIGAQLPGNAILGARALSQLEGHTVTVTDFFERMHKGMLLSANFVPAWAAAVKKMYEPLLPLAQMRPDVAITRLQNTFRMFAREVGSGAFMTAIGSSIKGISDQFTVMGSDGIPHLTDSAKKLADTLGKNLANIIHAVGDAFKYLVQHIHEIILGVKVMAAFNVATKLIEWGNAAYGAAESFKKLALAIAATNAASSKMGIPAGWFGLGKKAEGVAAETVASAGAKEAQQLSMFPMMRPTQGAFNFGETAFQTGSGGLSAGASDAEIAAALAANRRPAPGLWSRMNLFGRNAEGPSALQRTKAGASSASSTIGDFFADSSSGGRVAATAGAAEGAEGVAAGAEGATAALGGMGAALGGVATAAAGLAAVLGVVVAAIGGVLLFGAAISGFDTSLKTASGNVVKYGDIETAALSDMWDQIKSGFSDLSDGASDLSTKLLKLFGVTADGGKIFLGFIALLENAFVALYSEVSIPVRAVIALIKTVFDTIYDGAMMVYHAITGQGAQAYKDFNSLKSDVGGAWKEFGQGSAKDLSGADFNATYDRLLKASQGKADQHGDKDKSDAAAQRQIEAALRQQASAQIIENAAQKFAEASIGMNQITEAIDPDKLFAQIKQFASGTNPTAGLTPAQIQAAGPGANMDVKSIIEKAATAQGIDPQLLFNLGMSETHFDSKQYGWNKGGTSARGPFQLTNGALTDLSNAGYDTSDPFSLKGSAPLAAAYMKMAQDQFKKVAGRDLYDYEALLPFKLGGAGAGKLANTFDSGKGDSTLAKDLFPQGAAASANHSLFYATKDKSTPLTATDLYAKIVQMGGGSTPTLNGESPDVTALSPGQATGGSAADQAVDKVSDQDFKKFQALIAEGSPAAAAAAGFQERLVSIKDTLQQMQMNAAKYPWAKTFLGNPQILAGIQHAFEELKKREDEALDPIAHMNRLQEDANKLTLLRIRGFSDEAEYQAKINALVEQGDMREAIDLKNNHDKFMALQAETRAYEDILNIQKEILGLDTKRTELISKSPLQNVLNSQIAGAALPGESSLAQVQKRLQSTPGGQVQYAAMQVYAGASVASTGAAAMHDIAAQTDALAKQWGLDPTAKGIQDNYRTFLQQITGMSTSSISDLESAADDVSKKLGVDVKAFAQQQAQIKEQLENPPGFQKWVDGLEPLAKRLEDIKASFMDTLSGGIADALSGDKVNWGSMFHDLGKQVMKAQVDNVLSGILKGTGLAGDTVAATPEGRSIQSAATSLQTVADGSMTTAATMLQQAALALQQVATGMGAASQSVATTVSTANGALGNLAGAGGTTATGGSTAGLMGLGDGNTLSSGMTASGLRGTLSDGPMSPQGILTDLGLRGTLSEGPNPLLPMLGSPYTAGMTVPNGPISLPQINPSSMTLPALPNLGAGTNLAQSLNPNTGGGMFDWLTGGGSSDGISPVNVTPSPVTGTYSDGSSLAPDFLTTLGKAFGISSQNSLGTNVSNGLLSSLGMFGGLLSMLFGNKKPDPTYHEPYGIIGNMSTNTVSGTSQPGQPNVLGSLLNMFAQMGATSALGGGAGGGASGGFLNNLFSGGGGAGSTSAGILDFLGYGNNLSGTATAGTGGFLPDLTSLWGLFSEGGYATNPVTSVMGYNTLPHYAQGTGNTSGGIPAILHPDEAVIPLSRNRKVPVEMNGSGGGGDTNLYSNVTVIGGDADSFRKSKNAISRDQTRMLKRNAIRNLNN